MHDHTGLSFKEINELSIDEYLKLRRDAFIYKANQTEGGKKYLEKCWLYDQTEPDREGLTALFGKKERR